MNPKYPIYIISKGRWNSRKTVKCFERMRAPYRIVIEPQEFNQYSSVIEKSKILVLPFSNLNQGSIPARNWVFEHSIKEGYKKHWILDDNISDFKRLNKNRRYYVGDATILRVMEIFCDRYENIALAGPDYQYFVPDRETKNPYTPNTRIYSCILIDNSIPFRWRGKFNEDTDLSLRCLKANYCTILFKAFMQNKASTLTMKGGNTDTIYKQTNKRLEFAESIVKQHPDVARVVWRYNRWHHEVNYQPFKKNIIIEDKINNYGMELIKV